MKLKMFVCIGLGFLLAGCALFQPGVDEAQLQKEYRASQRSLERARTLQAPRYRSKQYQRASQMLQQVRQQHRENPSESLVSDYRRVQILAYGAAAGAAAEQLVEERRKHRSTQQSLEEARASLNRLQGVESERRQLQQRVSQLQNQAQQQSNRIRTLESENQSLQSRLQEQLALVDSLEQDRNRLQSRLDRMDQRMRQLRQQTEEIERQSREQLQDAEVRRDGNNVILTYQEKILFDLGSAEIKPEGTETLSRLGSVLKDYPRRLIRVEGHTDTNPINTRRYPTNWELSTHRATNVLRYLIEQEEISKQRITAVGYGEYHPVVPNTTPENQARNRRVEVVLYPRRLPLPTQPLDTEG